MKFIHLTDKSKNKLSFNKPGKYIVFFSNLSSDLTFEMNAKNVDVDIYGLYHGQEKEKFVIKTKQHHKSPGAKSNLLIKGIFEGSSSFHYEGIIRIEKKAQGTHAYQKNQNIILSDGVFVRSEPFLEILANEVLCTHGSTTGKLSRDQIYYLMSRGIDKKKSERFLLKGFLQEIYKKLDDEKVQTKGLPAFL